MDPKTLDTLRFFPVPPKVAWQRYSRRRSDMPTRTGCSAVEEAAWEQLQAALARAASRLRCPRPDRPPRSAGSRILRACAPIG